MKRFARYEPCDGCGSMRGPGCCLHFPKYANGFSARVNLAAECLKANATDSRAFDNCFEMDDGNFVVAALDHLANRSPAVRAGINRLWRSDESRAAWNETVQKLAHIRFDNLGTAAAKHRQRRNTACEDSHRQLALI